MAESPTVPKGIYEEAMEEMKKALSTIQCISVTDAPIPALEMQERHKQRILNAQKEKGLDTNPTIAVAGNQSSHSFFVKATALKTASGGGERNKGKGNKSKKKKVQYCLEEDDRDFEETKAPRTVSEIKESNPQIIERDEEDDLFASLTSYDPNNEIQSFAFGSSTKSNAPTKTMPLKSTPPPNKLSVQKPPIPAPPVQPLPTVVSIAEKPAKRQKKSNK